MGKRGDEFIQALAVGDGEGSELDAHSRGVAEAHHALSFTRGSGSDFDVNGGVPRQHVGVDK